MTLLHPVDRPIKLLDATFKVGHFRLPRSLDWWNMLAAFISFCKSLTLKWSKSREQVERWWGSSCFGAPCEGRILAKMQNNHLYWIVAKNLTEINVGDMWKHKSWRNLSEIIWSWWITTVAAAPMPIPLPRQYDYKNAKNCSGNAEAFCFTWELICC